MMTAPQRRRFPWPVYLIALIGIVGLAVLPMISVIAASQIAEANGCVLHEGYVNSCMVGGKDWGEPLYQLLVLGWLSLATIPTGLLAVVALFLAFVIHLVVFIHRKRQERVDA